MGDAVAGLIIWFGVFIGYILSKYLDRISRSIIALRIETSDWESGPDGIKLRNRADGSVEIVAIDGYRFFKNQKKYIRFLSKRPDRF